MRSRGGGRPHSPPQSPCQQPVRTVRRLDPGGSRSRAPGTCHSSGSCRPREVVKGVWQFWSPSPIEVHPLVSLSDRSCPVTSCPTPALVHPTLAWKTAVFGSITFMVPRFLLRLYLSPARVQPQHPGGGRILLSPSVRFRPKRGEGRRRGGGWVGGWVRKTLPRPLPLLHIPSPSTPLPHQPPSSKVRPPIPRGPSAGPRPREHLRGHPGDAAGASHRAEGNPHSPGGGRGGGKSQECF